MHIIRDSDTIDDTDFDEYHELVADDFMSRFLKRSDLDILEHNCSSHTTSGMRVYATASSLEF